MIRLEGLPNPFGDEVSRTRQVQLEQGNSDETIGPYVLRM
jgi:hypothetical protein